MILMAVFVGGCATNPYSWDDCENVKNHSLDYSKSDDPNYYRGLVEFCTWDESRSQRESMEEIDRYFPKQ